MPNKNPLLQKSKTVSSYTKAVILKLGGARSFQGGHKQADSVFLFFFFLTCQEFPTVLRPYSIYKTVFWLMCNVENKEAQ